MKMVKIAKSWWSEPPVLLYVRGRSYKNGVVCVRVFLGLWDLRCAPPSEYRNMLCTINLRCAPWCTKGTYVRQMWRLPPTFVVDNVTLYRLSGAQDDNCIFVIRFLLSASAVEVIEMISSVCVSAYPYMLALSLLNHLAYSRKGLCAFMRRILRTCR